jgi:hypothetical protein
MLPDSASVTSSTLATKSEAEKAEAARLARLNPPPPPVQKKAAVVEQEKPDDVTVEEIIAGAIPSDVDLRNDFYKYVSRHQPGLVAQYHNHS